ncbi:MAG: hypothetical protein SNJ67_11765 [Chloracidobacterium sp.]
MTEPDFKDVVGWTLPDAQARLGGLGWQREVRPEMFRSARFDAGSKSLLVTADGWQMADGKLCGRYARIQTAAADVATLMIYPTASPDVLPVFACEWVVIGARAHVLVLDVECLGDDNAARQRARAALAPLFARYAPSLPPVDDPPQWFVDIREDWALLTSGDLACLSVARQAFQDYLEMTARALYEPWLATARAGDDHPVVRAYKEHHAAHSPAPALLSAKAGEQWTRTFLHTWHFGPVQPTTASQGNESSN